MGYVSPSTPWTTRWDPHHLHLGLHLAPLLLVWAALGRSQVKHGTAQLAPSSFILRSPGEVASVAGLCVHGAASRRRHRHETFNVARGKAKKARTCQNTTATHACQDASTRWSRGHILLLLTYHNYDDDRGVVGGGVGIGSRVVPPPPPGVHVPARPAGPCGRRLSPRRSDPHRPARAVPRWGGTYEG